MMLVIQYETCIDKAIARKIGDGYSDMFVETQARDIYL